MDLNTTLFIAFAVIMLFCCGGLGRLFSRNATGDHREKDHGGTATSATDKSGKRGGCCH